MSYVRPSGLKCFPKFNPTDLTFQKPVTDPTDGMILLRDMSIAEYSYRLPPQIIGRRIAESIILLHRADFPELHATATGNNPLDWI